MISPNYFDYAAATPMDPSVLSVMTPYFTDNFYNPSAQYLAAKGVAKDIKEARESVARILGVRPGEVIFVAGGTEANNLAIKGIMTQYQNAEMLISSIEHASISEPANDFSAKQVKVDHSGAVGLNELKKLINDKTVLVSIIYANNEIGTVQSLKKISAMVVEERRLRLKNGNELPIILHTDASQAGNYLNLNLNSLGVDMMTINGGKIYGPKQTGVLVARGVSISPIIGGGGQERNLRSGTENVAGIVGFAKALEQAQQDYKLAAEHVLELRHVFEEELSRLIPDSKVNGGKNRLPNSISVTIPDIDNERITMLLDENGIQAAAGSACSASKDEPSHVLKAVGLSDKDARSTIRFSLGKFTTADSVKNAVHVLAKLCAL